MSLESQTKNQKSTKNPADTLEIISVDLRLLQEFLKFQGRCFKQPLHTTLAFFAQNPNAEMIQEKSVWERFGCTPKDGETPCLVQKKDGTFAEFFDFSQMNGQRPNIWNVDENGIELLKEKYKIAHKIEFGDLLKHLARRDSFEGADGCADYLKLDKKDFLAFRSLYNSAVMLSLAGRFELGSELNFSENMAIAEKKLYDKLTANNENFGAFLTSVTATVNKILFTVEKDFREEQAQNATRTEQIRGGVAEVYGAKLPDTEPMVHDKSAILHSGVGDVEPSGNAVADTSNGLREGVSATISDVRANGEMGENAAGNLRKSSDEGDSLDISSGLVDEQFEQNLLLRQIEQKEIQIANLQKDILNLRGKFEREQELSKLAESQDTPIFQKSEISEDETKKSNIEPKNNIYEQKITPKKSKKKQPVDSNQLNLFSFFEDEVRQEKTFEMAETQVKINVSDDGKLENVTVDGDVIFESEFAKSSVDDDKAETLANNFQDYLDSKDVEIYGEPTITKSQNKTTISFSKVGDFYECKGEDAEVVAGILDLQIVDKNGENIIGIPSFKLNDYKNI